MLFIIVSFRYISFTKKADTILLILSIILILVIFFNKSRQTLKIY